MEQNLKSTCKNFFASFSLNYSDSIPFKCIYDNCQIESNIVLTIAFGNQLILFVENFKVLEMLKHPTGKEARSALAS